MLLKFRKPRCLVHNKSQDRDPKKARNSQSASVGLLPLRMKLRQQKRLTNILFYAIL
jgi:hypothetical protein